MRFDTELLQHGADLWAAAMHHHRIDARLLEQNHVAGETAAHALVTHGVAAIFHDHDGIVVAEHVRQSLHQDLGLLLRASLVRFRHGRIRSLQ